MRRGVLLIAGVLAGCAPAPAAGPAPEDGIVAPGDARVDGRRLTAVTETFAWTLVDSAGEHPAGTRTDELSVRDGVVRRVQTVRRGPTALVDSSEAEARSLRPASHVSHQPTRVTRLRFAGDRVAGEVAPRDGERRVVADSLERAAFDSGNWDLVVRALPLRSGLAGRMPVYDQDNRLGWYEFRVLDPEAVNGAPAWRIEATLGRSRMTMWVDERTRAVVAAESRFPDGRILRQRPQ